ncbi:hypothetical protein AAG906_022838 [Vitis piasezkii]
MKGKVVEDQERLVSCGDCAGREGQVGTFANTDERGGITIVGKSLSKGGRRSREFEKEEKISSFWLSSLAKGLFQPANRAGGRSAAGSRPVRAFEETKRSRGKNCRMHCSGAYFIRFRYGCV